MWLVDWFYLLQCRFYKNKLFSVTKITASNGAMFQKSLTGTKTTNIWSLFPSCIQVTGQGQGTEMFWHVMVVVVGCHDQMTLVHVDAVRLNMGFKHILSPGMPGPVSCMRSFSGRVWALLIKVSKCKCECYVSREFTFCYLVFVLCFNVLLFFSSWWPDVLKRLCLLGLLWVFSG